jgi:hypothetical protein
MEHPMLKRLMLTTATTVLLAGGAQAQQLGDIFVISMENHNFTQPANQSSPNQIFDNPAAPFQNSLITPGNPNAVQTSYASNYQNAGAGIHPSLPNYIWSEAGSNLGVVNDNPPFGTTGYNPFERSPAEPGRAGPRIRRISIARPTVVAS